MILYTNGCSFTWGGSLDHIFCDGNLCEVDEDKRLPILWPHHLGKLLNADSVVNLSDGCGSNQRIVRTTYNWLRSKTVEELKETIAVIQLTEWSRFEMYDTHDIENEWAEDPVDWIKCKVDLVTHEYNHYPKSNFNRDILLKKATHTLKNTHPLEHFYRNIGYMYALQGMFNAFGVKDFYIWNHSHAWHFWPKEHRDVIFNTFNVLDEVHDWEKFRWSDDYWVYDRVSKDDWHPSVHGHIELANVIHDRMKRKGYRG